MSRLMTIILAGLLLASLSMASEALLVSPKNVSVKAESWNSARGIIYWEHHLFIHDGRVKIFSARDSFDARHALEKANRRIAEAAVKKLKLSVSFYEPDLLNSLKIYMKR